MSSFLRAEQRAKLALQQQEDNIVCAFGPDYFRGARSGSGCGGLFSTALFLFTFDTIKRDHVSADYEAGLRGGQRNINFSRWTLFRGIRTMPTRTLGCVALGCTSTIKCVKFFLAHRRCQEFSQDEEDFAHIEALSRQDSYARELFHFICDAAGEDEEVNNSGGAKPGLDTSRSARDGFEKASFSFSSRSSSNSCTGDTTRRRPPTFMDGFAVGVLGTILDCYTPQKSLHRYYGMRLGW